MPASRPRVVSPLRLRTMLDASRERLLALSAAGAVVPARPCERCRGRSVVMVPELTYRERLEAIVRTGRLPETPIPDACPACWGTGTVDAYREAQIWRNRCARLQDGCAELAEYAAGCAEESATPDKARCLRLVSHALRAQVEDWGPLEPERGREIDLRAESGDPEGSAANGRMPA